MKILVLDCHQFHLMQESSQGTVKFCIRNPPLCISAYLDIGMSFACSEASEMPTIGVTKETAFLRGMCMWKVKERCRVERRRQTLSIIAYEVGSHKPADEFADEPRSFRYHGQRLNGSAPTPHLGQPGPNAYKTTPPCIFKLKLEITW